MNYHILKQITIHQVKILRRDRGLNGIMLFCIVLIAFAHIMIQSNIKSPTWIAISLSSAIPFANAYLINYLQVLIIIFWAGNSIRKDMQADSSDAIQTRPYDNTEWLWGKIMGFIVIMLIFDITAAIVAMVIHLFVSDSPFTFHPYLFYFFTLTLPTLIFMTGLTICLKGIVKKTFIASLILLGLSYFIIAHGAIGWHGAIDLFASTLPNTFSDTTGFPHLSLYLMQRGAFLFVGIGLLVLGIYSITRIPNRPEIRRLAWIPSLACLIVGVTFSCLYLHSFNQANQKHQAFRETFLKYEDYPKVRITNHDIQFKQNEHSFSATSRITVYNPHEETQTSFILYLNPGLEINHLSANNQSLDFERENQIITVQEPLGAKETKEFILEYSGTICPEVCYAEVEDLNTLTKIRKYYIFNVGNDLYYLQPDFTLLTPECLWYPDALPSVNIRSPYTTVQSYTRFQLTVTGETTRTPISQGMVFTREDTTRFINKNNQSGLSLCIGDYTKKSVMIDSVLFEAYLFKGHEYLVEQFGDPHTLLPVWLASPGQDHQEYFYRKLSMVETPVNFRAYSRSWKEGSEYIQPEIIFRPEREALVSYAPKVLPESINPGMPPEVECFSAYMQNYSTSRSLYLGSLFFDKLFSPKWESVKNEYDISPLLQKYHVHVTSPEFPGINLIFQDMLSSWEQALSSYNDSPSWEYASTYFNDHNLVDVFNNPVDDVQFQQLIHTKSLTLLLRTINFVPLDKFKYFIEEFNTRHAFQEVSYELLCRELQVAFSIDLLALTRQLYMEKGLPDFRVKDVKVQWIENSGEIKGYALSLKVWNRGKVDGTITITGSAFDRNIQHLIPAGACQEISNYILDQPNEIDIQVQTNLARNIPAFYSFQNIQPEGFTQEIHPGVTDIDTACFMPDPNMFIVDNEDQGFHIIESAQALTRLVREQNKNNKNTSNSKTWTRDYYNKGGIGEPIRSYHKKLAGTGESNVEWETTLPEAGIYELFVYHDEMTFKRNGYIKKYVNRKELTSPKPTQTYLFLHKGGNEKITLETEEAGYGWISLGKFPFPAGKTKVTLLDIGSGPYQAIIADAVKWVKCP